MEVIIFCENILSAVKNKSLGTISPTDQRMGTTQWVSLLVLAYFARLILFTQVPFLSESRLESNIQQVVVLN